MLRSVPDQFQQSKGFAGPKGRAEMGLMDFGMEPLEVRQYTAEDLPAGVAACVNALLSQQLAAEPERIDLWRMRFQLCVDHGFVDAFAVAMREAWSNSAARAQLDWMVLERQWHTLAPGQALPDSAAGHSMIQRYAERFGDVALRVAGPSLLRLQEEYQILRRRPDFHARFLRALMRPLHRNSPLWPAENLVRSHGALGTRIFLKREDQRKLSPEIENAVAQAWIARELGKSRLIAAHESSGHARSLAKVCAALRLPFTLFLSREEFLRQADLLVALQSQGVDLQVVGDDDARTAALAHWAERADDAHLVLLGAGPAPYPDIVADFQSLLARETLSQYETQVEAPVARLCWIAGMSSRADALGFLMSSTGCDAARVCVTPAETASAPSSPAPWSGAYRDRRREHAQQCASGAVTYLAVEDAACRAAQAALQETEGIVISTEEARPLALALHRARSSTEVQDLVVLVA